jgi:hypothetical protein
VKSGPVRFAVAALVALVVSACDGGDGVDEPSRRCEVPLVVPEGFEVTGGIDDPQRDWTGVRIDLTDDGGAELHFFSGIRGEFGEGLPVHGRIALADGKTAVLVGRDTTWLLEWTTAPPCTPTVVLANGVDRRRFRELLEEAGAVRGAGSDESPTA